VNRTYKKLLELGLIYPKLTGYEKNFIKRMITHVDPNNIEDELSRKQLKYIKTLHKQYHVMIEVQIERAII